MNKFLSNSYDTLEENITYMKSLKVKSYPGENVTDCCDEILVDAERLESDGDFNPEHIGYITYIFEDNSDPRFCIWEIQKYKDITEFIKKLCVCDLDVISPGDLITYEFFVQEATHEHCDFVYSKWWEMTTSKDKYQDQPS